MKRRGFLGTLLGTPAMTRVAVTEDTPDTGKIQVSEVKTDEFTVDSLPDPKTCDIWQVQPAIRSDHVIVWWGMKHSGDCRTVPAKEFYRRFPV